MPNIWAMDSENGESKPAADKKDEKSDEAETKDVPEVFGPSLSEDDDELEKPSFLRRLTRHKKEAKKDEKSDNNTDKSK
jgi:hypothetical protein